MKKTTAYAFLGSSLIISNPSFAADGLDGSGDTSTPIASRTMAEKKKIDDSLLTTPALRTQVEQKIPSGISSDVRRKLFVEAGVMKEKQLREEERRSKYSQIERDALEARVKREREHAEQRAAEEASIHKKLIEEAKEATQKKFEENENLNHQIISLTKAVKSLELDAKNGEAKLAETERELTETGEFSNQIISQMDEENKRKAAELDEAREKLLDLEMKFRHSELQLRISKNSEEELKKGLEEIAASRGGVSSSSLSTPAPKSLEKRPVESTSFSVSQGTSKEGEKKKEGRRKADI